MNNERMESSPRPERFHFRVKRHPGRKAVSLFEGADEYVFVWRNEKPFMVSQPGERDIKEKLPAMMQQAAAILEKL